METRQRIRVEVEQGGFRILERINGKSSVWFTWPGLFETASSAWAHILQSGVKY